KELYRIDSIQSKNAKCISAKLIYTPTHCEYYSVKSEYYMIYKNETRAPRIMLHSTSVNVAKRFFRKACNSIFIEATLAVTEALSCFGLNEGKSTCNVYRCKIYNGYLKDFLSTGATCHYN